MENTVTDYSIVDNWLAYPKELTHEADTIYFCPTCYAPEEKDAPLICDINNPSMRANAEKYRRLQASVFAESTDVFIPFYRQCNAFSAGRLSKEEELKLYEGAPRQDIFAALDHYFSKINKGRPFFLAGHSQGSLMALYVLTMYFAKHPDYYRHMVAAYVIGFGVFDNILKSCPFLKMAQRADDTGVIISYNTEGPENIQHKSVVLPPGSIAINPLNWRTDDTYASISLNKGSLYMDKGGNCSIGEPMADAQICLSRGSVICRSLTNPHTYHSRHVSSFGPASFHSMDYSFYYVNLQENIALRLKKYLEKAAKL
ncbi:MAG: DUF3089 domain-containing protein [Candidatus Bruticola sp.]